MIEAILRKVFKAPSATVVVDEDSSYPRYAVGLPEFTRMVVGVEPGEQAFISSERVTVFDADPAVASTHLIGLIGHGPHQVRRAVLSRLLRHLIGASWTLVGMAIVLLTLSGTVQIISLIFCVVAFVLDVMSIYLREP